MDDDKNKTHEDTGISDQHLKSLNWFLTVSLYGKSRVISFSTPPRGLNWTLVDNLDSCVEILDSLGAVPLVPPLVEVPYLRALSGGSWED